MGITTCSCSRGLLEEVLRRRVLGGGAVEAWAGHAITGLSTDPEGDRVTGVLLRSGAAPPRVLDADLVVVADGAASALPGWLTGVGLPPADRIVVDGVLHSTSTWLSLPAPLPDDLCFLSVSPAADGPRRSGALLRTEEDRWALVLLGPVDEPPPRDHGELIAAAGKLADGRLREILAEARLLGPLVYHGRYQSRLHHYQRAPRWPDRLVALGDAVCALDPYFGLGMTACARGVEVLAAHLAEGLGGPDDAGAARRFQEALAGANAVPWEIVTGRSLRGRVDARRAYALDCLHRLAPESPAAARLLLERMHLLTTPDALDAPEVAALLLGDRGRAGEPPRRLLETS
jgi:2-polyprenyl-6-methoxyphenol hydroxylase-like FAD-dependent oxidoreductase